MAKLYFRYGAMNSGKSTALMQVAHNYEEQGMRVLILKPQVDTKGGGELVSRLGVRRKADLLIPPETDVFEAVRTANADGAPLACVLCDESQFFTPEQAEQLFMVTVDLNIPVICYGLRSDFSLKGFPGSPRLLELIRAEALTRGYHIITCPCAMHPEDKIDHILIPELKLAFLTDNRWHPVHLPSVQAVRCTRFLDRENLAAYRARLRFNERAAAELLEQASALMAQAKSCHDELETYYRAAVDFGKVDEAAAECMEMFGLK